MFPDIDPNLLAQLGIIPQHQPANLTSLPPSAQAQPQPSPQVRPTPPSLGAPGSDFNSQLMSLGLTPQMLSSYGINLSGLVPGPTYGPPLTNPRAALGIPPVAAAAAPLLPQNPLLAGIDPSVLAAIGSAALMNPALLAGALNLPSPLPAKPDVVKPQDSTSALITALLGGENKASTTPSTPSTGDLKKQLISALLERKKEKDKEKDSLEKKSGVTSDLLKTLLTTKMAEIAQESGQMSNNKRRREEENGEGDDLHNAAKKQKSESLREPMKPGDWICEVCGEVNFAKRTICFKCNLLRGTPPSANSGSKRGTDSLHSRFVHFSYSLLLPLKKLQFRNKVSRKRSSFLTITRNPSSSPPPHHLH